MKKLLLILIISIFTVNNGIAACPSPLIIGSSTPASYACANPLGTPSNCTSTQNSLTCTGETASGSGVFVSMCSDNTMSCQFHCATNAVFCNGVSPITCSDNKCHCDAGYGGNGSACSTCSNGQQSPQGTDSCNPCGNGTYSDTHPRISCSNCGGSSPWPNTYCTVNSGATVKYNCSGDGSDSPADAITKCYKACTSGCPTNDGSGKHTGAKCYRNSGDTAWSGGCSLSCNNGYYVNGASCSSCSTHPSNPPLPTTGVSGAAYNGNGANCNWSATLSPGYYWDGSSVQSCGSNYYCPGTDTITNTDPAKGRIECPPGYSGSNPQSINAQGCFMACSISLGGLGTVITNGANDTNTTTNSSYKSMYNGSYPPCSFEIKCNPGWKPSGTNPGPNPSCADCSNKTNPTNSCNRAYASTGVCAISSCNTVGLNCVLQPGDGSPDSDQCVTCNSGQYLDASNNPQYCPAGYWCASCKMNPCPAASTTRCVAPNTGFFATGGCTTHTRATGVEACALMGVDTSVTPNVGPSTICDKSTPQVCYTFTTTHHFYSNPN